MIGLVATLLGSRTGRTAAIILLALASAGLLLWRVFAAGKASATADQARATLDFVRKKVKSDESIARLSAVERRRRLAKWVRDNEQN